MPNKFRAELPPENILAKAIGSKIKVDLLAAAIGTKLPFRDDNGDPIIGDDGFPKTFTATDEALKKAVDTFTGGIFNANHTDEKIGEINQAYFLNGFAAKGEVTCPIWCGKIVKDEYTGVSVEGFVEGNLADPDSATVNITAIAFLDEKRGACPKDQCHVKSFAGGKVLDEVKVEADDITQIEAAWSPNYDAYWSYIETDGKISQTKARQIFLKKTGTGENRGDWHYPICTMSNGKPVVSKEGLMAAYKRAAQQGDSGVLRKLPGKFRKAGVPVPEGLKGSEMKLEASVDDKGRKFSAKLVDDDGVVMEKEIFVVDNLEVENMADDKKDIKAETPIESAPAAETAPVGDTTPVTTPAPAATTPVVTTPAPVEPNASDHVHDLKNIVTVDSLKEQVDPWALIGVKKEDFEQMRAAYSKLPTIEEKLQTVLAENKDLQQFKMESQIQDLQRSYPPALWDGDVKIKEVVDGKEVEKTVPKKLLLYQELIKDPAAFTLKYEADRVKFAAAQQTGQLAGSAATTVENEEILASRKRRDNLTAFLRKTGGSIRR